MAIPTPHVIRSHRSSIAIQIDKDGTLIVKAPHLVPQFVINNFIREKSEWIEKTLAKVTSRQPKAKMFSEGEEFLFLGISRKLLLTNDIEIRIQKEQLLFPRVMLLRAQKELTLWYRKQAETIITQRVKEKAKEMHASYKDIFFSDTKSKWGTCFADNTLQFNWRLVMAPLMVIDYVVIHELVHTTEKHHQDSFWRRVRNFTPAYKQHRKWLDVNAHLLSI